MFNRGCWHTVWPRCARAGCGQLAALGRTTYEPTYLQYFPEQSQILSYLEPGGYKSMVRPAQLPTLTQVKTRRQWSDRETVEASRNRVGLYAGSRECEAV